MPVGPRARPQLVGDARRRGDLGEQLDHASEPGGLVARLEQLLLGGMREFHASGQAIGQLRAGERRVDTMLAVLCGEVQEALDRGLRERIDVVCLVVLERRGARRRVGVDLSHLEQADGGLAAGQDVRAAIGEPFEDLCDPGRAGDVGEALIRVPQDDRERLVRLAAGDELPVARLEDVQRQDLVGEEHQFEREQRDVVEHARSVRPNGPDEL